MSESGKKTRSRKGCNNCKKAKIKCDELKPTCSSCLKFNRVCDYSIKLTWGGRPYKVPKIEKMNPVANLQRSVHINNVKKLKQSDIDSIKQQPKVSQNQINTPTPYNNTPNSVNTPPVIPDAVKLEIVSSSSSSAPTSPAVSTLIHPHTNEDKGFDNVTTTTTYAHDPRINSPIPSLLSAEVNHNINSLSNVLDNIINDDVFKNYNNGRSRRASIASDLSPLGNDFFSSHHANIHDTNAFQDHRADYYNSPDNNLFLKNKHNDRAFDSHLFNRESPSSMDTPHPGIFVDSLQNVYNAEMNLNIDNSMNKNGTNESTLATSTNTTIDFNNHNIDINMNNHNGNSEFMNLIGEYSEDLLRSEANLTTNGSLMSIPLRYSHSSGNRYRSSKVHSLDDEGAYDDEEEEEEEEEVEAQKEVEEEIEEVFTRARDNLLVDNDNINNALTPSSNLDMYQNHDDFGTLYNKYGQYVSLSPNYLSSSPEYEYMESIPRGIVPLPDILLNVPYYYDHFQFYINTTADILIPVHPSIYNNPFKVVLPKLAMSNDILMSLLIAFGITHKSYLLNKEEPKEIVDQLLSRTMSGLFNLLQDKSTAISDLTLSVVMLLSSYMGSAFKGDKWQIHLKGAKQILLMRGYKKPFAKLIRDAKDLSDNSLKNSTNTVSVPSVSFTDSINIDGEMKESKLVFFMVRWYAFIDVLASLASPLAPTKDLVNAYASGELSLFDDDAQLIIDSPDSPKGLKINNGEKGEKSDINYELEDDAISSKHILLTSESFSEVDYFLGFNIKFLTLYTKIIHLIEATNIIKEYEILVNGKFQVDPRILTQALEIISRFDKLDNFQSQLVKLDSSTTISESNKSKMRAIIASNHIFAIMGKLTIYTRVLGTPRNSNIIQELCNDAQIIIQKYIPEGSSTDMCLLFPSFVTGCEILSKSGRKFFQERLTSLGKKASPGAFLSRDLMQLSWENNINWYDVFPRDKKTHFIFL